ncbi:Protein of unknown function [Lactobacillus helveticus CIRM-BIA 104]|uniref:Uncharacterized protein n=2 Tax=Lactobacillus helveticus TaxID=1587 RepID=U4QCZ2_LACHE|nr:Protein of unknown function [Lactobacillus helveticus CIRM-BIA 953]CDI59773.1 Protein of unknown function [Lactobacillus helveticus CIRM-BIA 104]CDI62764.1 Protein of unknown function [Lactobacillus helveticus CIRM-BIA 103]
MTNEDVRTKFVDQLLEESNIKKKIHYINY